MEKRKIEQGPQIIKQCQNHSKAESFQNLFYIRKNENKIEKEKNKA